VKRVGIAAFSIALATMAGCAHSNTGLVSQADIPSTLGLRLTTTTASDGATRAVISAMRHPAIGCSSANLALFTPPGRPYVATGPQRLVHYPEILSWASGCSTKRAEQDLDHVGVLAIAAQELSDVGDGAYSAFLTTTAGSYDAVFWREGGTIGTIEVSEPPGNGAATEALARRLAKLAAASS